MKQFILKALVVFVGMIAFYFLFNLIPRKHEDLCLIPTTDVVVSCSATEEEANAELKAHGYNLCYGVECGARLQAPTIDN